MIFFKMHLRTHTGQKVILVRRLVTVSNVANHLLHLMVFDIMKEQILGKSHTLPLLSESFFGKTGIKETLTEHCIKSFSTYSGLQYHLHSHTGEKPYHCHFCGSAFAGFQQLKQHLSKCQYCSKAFICNSILKKHLWVHKKKKSHKCQYCSEAFAELSALKLHLWLDLWKPFQIAHWKLRDNRF